MEEALKAQSDLQGRSKQIVELEAGENACDISLPPMETEMERQSRILSALEGPSQERLVNNPAPGRKIIESSHYQPSQAPNFPSAFCRIPDVKIEPFSGNVVEFPAWEIAFNALIESQLTSIELKINLLSQHLSGEAKFLVLGLLSNHTESSYQAARNRLKQRYGNPTIISQAFLDKLHEWPIIKSHQAEELLKFSDLLVQISEIKKNVSGLGILDFPQETKIILSKLPTYIENEWRNSVCIWREVNNSYSYPPFEYFVQFIERRATRANIPELQNIVRSSGAIKPTNTRRDSKGAMALTTSISDKSLICTYCSKNHDINNCVEFSRLSRETCMNFLKDRRLCFACGSTSEHYSRICNNRSKCKICGKWHLTALHIYNNDVVTSLKCTEVDAYNNQSNLVDNSMIVPVWVRSKMDSSKEILCYCILDDQSNACFISNKLRQQLGVSGSPTTLTLSTMHKSRSFITCKRVSDLEVLSFDRKTCIQLPPVFTRDHIPASRSQIPKPEVARSWKHLEAVSRQMVPFHDSADVAILIGNNLPSAIRPREFIAGNDDEPYAQKSILGWGIVGVVGSSEKGNVLVSNRISVSSRSSLPLTMATSKALVKPQETYSNAKFVFTTKTKEIFNPLQVRQMMEIDFIEPGGKNIELSIEDQRFVKKLSDNIQQQDDGHYVMPLPLKSNQIALPNNRPLAFKRLMQLKCRFRRNPLFRQDYVKFMNEVITNWAEKIPDFELNLDNGNVNYVPHTGVYHPKKPGKIRVVFDCSAEFEGVSINDYLLRGPNLMNGLVGVLCRFRLEEVALVADIKAMFHQFLVCKGDRDLLRFLWWENGDTKKPVKEYRMMVHLFGAVSSPGCANFGLKRAADDGEIEFGEAAVNFVRNNFYVDDGLISVSSVKEAIDLLRNSRDLCARAELKLHEVVSNKLEVLECLPESDRATSKSFNIRTDSLPLERALGVVWCIQNDTFQFRINTRNKVRCSFVLGKARVASLKQITPTAAVVLGKMNKFLKDESKLVNVKEYFLVDSKIVLGYINDEDFRTYP